MKSKYSHTKVASALETCGTIVFILGILFSIISAIQGDWWGSIVVGIISFITLILSIGICEIIKLLSKDE